MPKHLLELTSLPMLYLIRNHYLEQDAKSVQHQHFLDERIALYSREIYRRENDVLHQMDTQFADLLKQLNDGFYIHITTQ